MLLTLVVLSVLFLSIVWFQVIMGLKRYEVSLGRVTERVLVGNIIAEELRFIVTVLAAVIFTVLVAAFFATDLLATFGRPLGIAIIIAIPFAFIIVMRLVYAVVGAIKKWYLGIWLQQTAPMLHEERTSGGWHKHDKKEH